MPPARAFAVPEIRKQPLRLLPTVINICLWLLPALFILNPDKAQSQDFSLPQTNVRFARLPAGQDTIRLDSFAAAAYGLHVAGVADTDFLYLPAERLLVWRHRPAADSVTIRYRALPLAFNKIYFHKDARLLDSQVAAYDYQLPGMEGKAAFVDYSELEYSGAIGRAIAVGNTQDVTLNSSLNLQANGYILDSVKVEAAITDNTVPFQPEGNTQRVQEFDQIFIHLQKGFHNLQLGDYNLERPKGYFLNYYKRVQGINFQSRFLPSARSWNAYGASISVAKGQFARNIFQGLEGNQGPYKLQGNNGEQFFIVLAATERVFINGVLMERGEQADYIINYNTAEIRFMPRRLITKDSRIQVEFEYQDRTYLNSLITAYDELQLSPRLNLRMNIYANQDAKNQSFTQSLDGAQKRFLSAIGDSTGNALYPVIAADTFGAGKILYRLTDTSAGGTPYDSVFVYATQAAGQLYALSFSFVGQGRGSYIISSSNANGRVYEWIAPVDGVRQGSYEPVQLLITPKTLQVATLAATYGIDSFKSVFVEGAVSNYDPNTFSKLDNRAHGGLAAKARYNEIRFFAGKDSAGLPGLSWANELTYEYVQDRFRAVAPFRNVEFGRDWNVPQQQLQTGTRPTENLYGYTTKLTHQRLGLLGYGYTRYERSGGYTGNRHEISYLYQKPRIRSGFLLSLTNTADSLTKSRFFRPSAFAEYQLKKDTGPLLGARYSLEHNKLAGAKADTLRTDAFAFDVATGYLRSAVERPFHYDVSYTYRRDYSPDGARLLQRDYSRTLDGAAGYTRAGQSVSVTGSYRTLVFTDTMPALQPEQTALARIEHSGTLLHGVLQLNALYEIGSGQEQKRQYTYLEVPAGQGVYTWNDYNTDGVQQANEFEVALYPDQKKFIRLLTVTNEYVKVNYVNYNQSIYLEPSNFWKARPTAGFGSFISRISNQASLQISNRLLTGEGAAAYNPFRNTIVDDNVILTANTFNNTFYYNRNSTTFGLDYNYLHASTKQLLTYGVEGSKSTQHLPRVRFAPGRSFTGSITGRAGNKAYNSALADGRTYSIANRGAEPSVTYLYRAVFRATGTFRYEERHNLPAYGGETANISTASLELRYNQPAAGTISARGTFSGIDYNGKANTAVAFSLLEALQPGANFLWYLNWERRVGKGIELTVEYEGRQAGSTPVVHTGRMSIRAIL